jgi:hypothetical protein
MPPRSSRSTSAVADPPAGFDPNQPIDPAAVFGDQHAETAGETAGETTAETDAATDAAQADLQTPGEVRAVVNSLTQGRTVDPTRKFEKPPEPHIGDNAKARLLRACGTTAELRGLQTAAEAAQRAADDAVKQLERERDAEIERLRQTFGERIAAARQSSRGAMDKATTMRSARDQVLASAPKWLRDQMIARERAIVQAHHQATTVLQSEVEKKRNFVYPPTHRHGAHACATADFAAYVQQQFSEGHQFVPSGGKRDLNVIVNHLRRLHSEWEPQLPALEKQLAENLAAKQRDVDAAEDEAIGVAIESM